MALSDEFVRRGQIGIPGMLLVTFGVALSVGFIQAGASHRNVDIFVARSFAEFGVFCFAGTAGALITRLLGRPYHLIASAFLISGLLGILMTCFFRTSV
jgi:hypothetical protein